MALDNLKIGLGDLSEAVYAGYVNKESTKWVQKIDITNQVFTSIALFVKNFGDYTKENISEHVYTLDRIDGTTEKITITVESNYKEEEESQVSGT